MADQNSRILIWPNMDLTKIDLSQLSLYKNSTTQNFPFPDWQKSFFIFCYPILLIISIHQDNKDEREDYFNGNPTVDESLLLMEFSRCK